jgi:hypothetical protein
VSRLKRLTGVYPSYGDRKVVVSEAPLWLDIDDIVAMGQYEEGGRPCTWLWLKHAGPTETARVRESPEEITR